jgi:histidinol-phosphatase (PHP family)
MKEMCAAAIDRGIQILGFSDHYDLLPEDPCFDFFRADDWWGEYGLCRQAFEGDLTLVAGIEIGEPHRFPKAVEELLGAYPWDYSLGSLHWVGNQNVFSPEYFDYGKDLSYRRYFTELLNLVREGTFDILAHMDIVKRYGFDFHGPYDPVYFEESIREVLRTCAQKGIAIEVNTSTLRRPIQQTTPTNPILEWFRQEGGQWVTFGSDAHKPEHVGYGHNIALQSLTAAGFSYLAHFERRSPSKLPFSNGMEPHASE